MLVVHDERVRVAALTLEVRMIERQVFVGMLDDLGILLRPEAQRGERTGTREQGKAPEGHDRPELCHQPARERIGDKPAGVAEGELGGEERGTVLGMGRAAQETAGGGEHPQAEERQEEAQDPLVRRQRRSRPARWPGANLATRRRR